LSAVKPGNHGGNVYLRVEEVTLRTEKKKDGNDIQIAEGVAGDDSGVINFRVLGEYAKVMTKGSVVAFVRLRSNVVNEH